MSSAPRNWKPHEVAAYQAWQRGDQNRLVKACERVIARHARRFARASRKGSDELNPVVDAEFQQAGLYEARVVVDFDDLCQVGRQAVLEVQDRWNPEYDRSFQTFAYSRIEGAMKDWWDGQRKRLDEPESQALNLQAGLDAAIGQIQAGEHDDSVFFEGLYHELRHASLEQWRDIIQEARFETVRFFWGFLHQYAALVTPEIGERKHLQMLSVAAWQYWHRVFSRAAQTSAPFHDISGPQHMESIERGRKAYGPLPSKIDDRPLGRMFGKHGKTVARWRKDMEEVGAPPLMREDGSFTIMSQEDWDKWADYWFRIAEPQSWDRLQKRFEREAE
jgi:hypothetical protein